MQPLPQATPAIAAWDIAAPVNAATWSPDGKTAMAAAGDGHVYLLRPGMAAPLPVEVDADGAVLTLLPCGEGPEIGAYAGTDTGHVGLVTTSGEWLPLKHYPGQFIEHLAYDTKTKLLAVSVGKTVRLLNARGEEVRTLGPHTSTVAGLAVSPLGARLAVAHYNGVSVWPLDNPKSTPRVLNWKGAHGALTYSPDGKWLISAMQEQAIHLWRLADGLDLQMRGYPGKITQFSWNHEGQLLATNGGSGVPLWNFRDKLKGPAGTQAQVVASSNAEELLVTAVACHPQGPFAAVGYTDGLVLLTNLQEDRAILLKEPGQKDAGQKESGQGACTTLAWDPTGMYLLTGTQNGWLSLTNFDELARK